MDSLFFTNVKFIKSTTSIKDRPAKKLPEIAFIGRSNVGKSSLLNAICNRRSIAKTSSIPGKTQLINYFEVSELCYFVDLPGYGYSKIPKELRGSWKDMIEGYLQYSDQIRLICLLIDSRHGLLENDIQMIDWLQFHQKPFTIILTKSDKISKSKLLAQQKNFNKELPDNRVFAVSINSDKTITTLNQYLFTLVNKSSIN